MTDWLIDLNGIKAKERKAFAEAMASGDDAQLYPYMARTIKTWPYASDPANVDSYGNLGLVEHTEAARQFALAFQRLNAALKAPANGGETAGEGRGAGTPEGADGSR